MNRTFFYGVSFESGTPSPPAPANSTSATSATIVLTGLAEGGPHAVSVWAQDNTAAVGAAQVVSWVLDTTPPDTSIEATSLPFNGAAVAGSVNFTMGCSEAACTFEYKLDGALEWQRSNGSATPAAPVVTTVDAAPGRLINVTSAAFTVAVDTGDFQAAGAVVRVTLDGGLPVEHPAAGGPVDLLFEDLPDGRHTMEARGVAGDGTAGIAAASYSFTVDTRAPTITVYVHPTDGAQPEPFTVLFGDDERDITFDYRHGPSLAGMPWNQTTEGVVTVSNMEASVTHVFEVYGVDPVANTGTVTTVSWTPSTCPPAASIPAVTVTSSNEPVGDMARVIKFKAVGDPAWPAFEYSLDNAPYVATQSPILLTGLAYTATQTVRIRAAVAVGCNAALAATRPPDTVVSWSTPPPRPDSSHAAVLLSGPPPSNPDAFAVFSMQVTHPRTYLQYSLNNVSWTPCDTRLTLGPLPYAPQVFAVDDGVTHGRCLHA